MKSYKIIVFIIKLQTMVVIKNPGSPSALLVAGSPFLFWASGNKHRCGSLLAPFLEKGN